MSADDREFFLHDLIDRATRRLKDADIEQPRREARLLAQWALGLEAATLLTRSSASALEAARFEAAVDRRCQREPFAMIVGHTGFWTLDLLVSSATLIPRADSETLIEALVEARPDRTAVRHILDLGTGTGALLLAALDEYPMAYGCGIDRSEEATNLAKANAARNHLADRCAFMCGDWDSAIDGRFDIVLSNPPYIDSDAIPGLMPEVAGYEPARALDGGPDGLDAYRRIVAGLPGLLNPGGLAILELGEGQRDAVSALALEAGLTVHAARPDLGGIPRALVLSNRRE